MSTTPEAPWNEKTMPEKVQTVFVIAATTLVMTFILVIISILAIAFIIHLGRWVS